MSKVINIETVQYPEVLIVGVQSPLNRSIDIESYFEEFRNLVESNGVIYQHEHYLKLREIDAGYFFTKGKLEEIGRICDENNIEEVIISETLSNQQQRNLQELLKVKLFDRNELILDIFKKGAQTAEGKIQIEITLLKYKKTRLAGRGIFFSQQAGKIGTKGPGETQKEKDTRHIELMISKLERDLAKLERARNTQRKQRQKKGIPHISLIGYTNAGKSTILNVLTKSNVLAEDRLFATLDTTTRELFINSKKKGVISDTVGFIQQLPHKLIEAFKSTLTELAYSNLLLQIIDASDTNWPEHIAVVREVLQELNVTDKPMVYVFNKIDRLPPEELTLLEGFAQKYQPHLMISSLSKETMQPLYDFLAQWNEPINQEEAEEAIENHEQ